MGVWFALSCEAQAVEHGADGQAADEDGKGDDDVGHGQDEFADGIVLRLLGVDLFLQREGEGHTDSAAETAPGHDFDRMRCELSLSLIHI